VIYPIYKGTFERSDNLPAWPKSSSFCRDRVIDWFKDMERSIDYLETRSDIDHGKVAYEGVSWGAAMGALLPAMDHRLGEPRLAR
jgi:eukaryotic-like serine/threonine-protein kinase